MKKVISFVVFGDNPIYLYGAINNAKLVPIIYPDWESWFYCAENLNKDILNKLKNYATKIIICNDEGFITTKNRFLPISEPDVGIMLVRDCDSRLSIREFYAVQEWLNSDKNFHVMRDHPNHSKPILAGMFGVRKPLLNNIRELINSFTWNSYYGVDEDFLTEIIFPIVQNDIFTHDAFYDKKFPTERINNEFVGSIFDESDNRICLNFYDQVKGNI
jgi:hypothetical protein